MAKKPRPTKADLEAAAGKTTPEVIAPGLKVLFVGINPGLYTAAVGHNFARPGNRFWPALYAAGITPRLFDPSEERELLPLGYGITNIVPRATARADELTREEMQQGGQALVHKIQRYQPALVVFLGVGAYRTAFNRPKARLGPQDELLGGTQVWVLPNPSGLNAHYNLPQLAELLRAVKAAAGGDREK
jgi:double-stranded uracil-DNA glycosylase